MEMKQKCGLMRNTIAFTEMDPFSDGTHGESLQSSLSLQFTVFLADVFDVLLVLSTIVFGTHDPFIFGLFASQAFQALFELLLLLYREGNNLENKAGSLVRL